MKIIIGIIVYLLAVAIFLAFGKFLKQCDDSLKEMRNGPANPVS